MKYGTIEEELNRSIINNKVNENQFTVLENEAFILFLDFEHGFIKKG